MTSKLEKYFIETTKQKSFFEYLFHQFQIDKYTILRSLWQWNVYLKTGFTHLDKIIYILWT